MTEVLIVTTMVDISTIKKKVGKNSSIRWMFLARDYRLMKQFSQGLGEEYSLINISDLLNQIADEIRTEHVEWIDSLNHANCEQLGWWFGAISSRNIYYCRVFLYSCYILTLQRIWQQEETRPNLIIAESPGLAECISTWLEGKNVRVTLKKGSVLKRLQRNSRPLLQFFITIVILATRYISAFISKTKKPRSIKNIPWVVIDTFVHDYSLAEDGKFSDRYFPFLHEYLASKGYNLLVHPVLSEFCWSYISIFRRMRKSLTNFIIQEDYLQLSDYAAALRSSITLRSSKIIMKDFKGFNLEPMVMEEHRLQSFVALVQANLAYSLWHRLRQAGVKLAWVINWYENQAIDKALIAGVRSAYPETKIVGAQIFIHIPNFISHYPSKSEFEAGITPDLMILTGKKECEAVQKYTKSLNCRAGAALRYSHLFTKTKNMEDSLTTKNTILVLTPGYMDETLEILDMLYDVMPNVPSEMVYLIKFHPDFSSSDIVDAFGREQWPKEFDICDCNITEAFSRAGMVIASNSSALVEAMVMGVPAIFLGRKSNLNMNPLSEINSASLITCFDTLQLAQAIIRFHSLSKDESVTLVEEGLSLRKQFFTSLDEGLGEFVVN